jgi:hypothetical protein
MGYWHVGQKGAPLINVFYREHFNEYLNFHRPCGFATVTVDEKGRRRKKYETYQTPYERLKSLENAGQYLREGLNFDALDKVAAQETDNESAASMQKAKGRLFEKLGHHKKRQTYNLKASIQIQKGGKDPVSTTLHPRSISGSFLD